MPAPNQQLLSLLLSKFGKGPTYNTNSASAASMANRSRGNLSHQFMGTQTPAMQAMLKYLDYKFFNPGIAGQNDSPGGGNVFNGFYRGGSPNQEGNPNVGNYGFLGGGPGGPGMSNMNHQGSWIDMFGKGTGQDQPGQNQPGGMGEFLNGGAENLRGYGGGLGGLGAGSNENGYYE